jgi:hypothetical protein
MAAGHVLVVLVVALVTGLLLNASDILRTAERQEAGFVRSLAVGIMEPISSMTSFLRIDRPRAAIDVALGREQPEQETVTTTTTLPVSTTTTTTVAQKRPITAADPLRMFIGGDSMVGQFGPMLQNRAVATGLAEAEVVYEFDSGLTRPDFIDWPERLREVGVQQDPDVVVLFFGGNDAQDIKIEGRWEPYGTEAWKAEYRSRVSSVMSQLESDGRDVYWMGMPIVSPASFRERVAVMNEIYRTEADGRDNVHFIDSWQVFSGPDGEYAEYLPDEDGNVVDMRLNDGIHLTTNGGILLAGEVWTVIAGNWDIG